MSVEIWCPKRAVERRLRALPIRFRLRIEHCEPNIIRDRVDRELPRVRESQRDNFAPPQML